MKDCCKSKLILDELKRELDGRLKFITDNGQSPEYSQNRTYGITDFKRILNDVELKLSCEHKETTTHCNKCGEVI